MFICFSALDILKKLILVLEYHLGLLKGYESINIELR